MTPEFCVFRIWGNCLPPRDELQTRLAAYQRILEDEPELEGASRWWVVNRVHDPEARAAALSALHAHRRPYLLLNNDPTEWGKLSDRNAKIIWAVGINQARNQAIRHGRCMARWTLVLDGDCWFDTPSWHEVRDGLRALPEQVRVAAIPMARLSGQLSGGEPMLAFRNDSVAMFDPKLPFGQSEKLALVNRLNPPRIGRVLHETTGPLQAETSLTDRMALREQSLDQLLATCDTLYRDFCPPESESQAFRAIPGPTELDVLYSHIAEAATAGDVLVEVGAGLGRSTIQLGQELKRRGVHGQVYAVDTWESGDHPQYAELKPADSGPGWLYERFLYNLSVFAGDTRVVPLRAKAEDATGVFPDESLSHVLITARDEPEVLRDQILRWWPKLRNPGILVGRGFSPDRADVITLLTKFFHSHSIEVRPGSATWIVRKGRA